MADDFNKREVLIEIEVDSKAAEKNVENLTSSIIDQQTAIKQNTEQIKDLEKANKSLDDEVKKGTKTQEQANKELVDNSKSIKDLKVQNASLKDGLKDLNRQRAAAVKVLKTESNTLQALRNESARLKKELNNQETATKDGRIEFDNLTKSLEKVNDKIRTLDKGAGDFKTNVGNYPKALDAARGAVVSLGGALKALGLGLIIAAVAKFTEALQENQRVADFLAKVTKTLGIAFNDLVNFLIDNLGTVKDLFSSTFEDPLGSLKALGNAIKDNLIERFNSFIEVLGLAGKAIKQVFEGDFSGAADTAKEAAKELVDVYTGIPNSVDRATDAIVKGGKAIADYAVSTYEAADSLVELEKQQQLNEIQQQRLIQQNERLAEQQRQIRDNDQLNIEDRIAANERLFEILDKQEQLEKQTTNAALERAKTQLAVDENNIEAQIAYQEALLATEDIQNRIEGQRSEALANRIALEKEREEIEGEALIEKRELEKESLARHLEELQAVRDAANEEQRLQEEAQAKVIAEIEEKKKNVVSNITNTASNIVERRYQKRFADLEKQFKSGQITEEEYAKKKEELEKKQAMEQYKVERATFIVDQATKLGQAGVDIARSITASVAASPLTGGMPWAGINAGIGAIQIGAIASTPPPQRPTFAEGGTVVSGKDHSQGGEDIYVGGKYYGNMQGGEGLFVTKREATKALLNDYNTAFGGRSFYGASTAWAEEGGRMEAQASQQVTAAMIAEALMEMPPPQVQVTDIQSGIQGNEEATNIAVI